jgi:hypothetical protein
MRATSCCVYRKFPVCDCLCTIHYPACDISQTYPNTRPWPTPNEVDQPWSGPARQTASPRNQTGCPRMVPSCWRSSTQRRTCRRCDAVSPIGKALLLARYLERLVYLISGGQDPFNPPRFSA